MAAKQPPPTGGAPERPSNALAKAFGAAVGHHKAGKLQEAEQAYRGILEQQPGQPDTLNMLGVVAGQRGQSDRAIDWFRQAVRADGKNPTFHYNLAKAQHATGDLDGAAAGYRHAVEIKPDYAEALKGLGGVLLKQNKLDEAEQCCREVVRLSPGDPQAHNNLGTVLIGRKASDEAADCAREAIRLMPDYADAHNNLGTALLATEAFETAAAEFREALRLIPKFPDALMNLGTALLGLGHHEEAMASLREAIAIAPGHVMARNNLANAYRELDYRQEARREFEAVIDHKSDYAPARFGLAGLLLDIGEIDAAIGHFDELLRQLPTSQLALSGKAAALMQRGDDGACYAALSPVIEAGTATPEVAAVFARIAPRFDRSGDAIALIEGLLPRAEGSKMPDRQRRMLEFALGQLCDEVDDFDRAFGHFTVANAVRPARFDPAAFAAKIDRIIGIYGRDGIETLPRATDRSELPVFIVGMPRSGTGLVERILAGHPAIYGAGEFDSIARAVRSLAGSDVGAPEYAGGFTDIAADALDALAREHLEFLGRRGGDATRVTDAMPYNFQHLGFIAQLFPESRIVHCVRDPLDTCLSCYFHDFSRGNSQTYDLGHLGAYHRHYQRLMHHWRGVLGQRILDVAYEDLADDIESASRRLVDFLGLDWDPGCLEVTAGDDRGDARSVGRWRHYDRHLGPLKEALANDA